MELSWEFRSLSLSLANARIVSFSVCYLLVWSVRLVCWVGLGRNERGWKEVSTLGNWQRATPIFRGKLGALAKHKLR